MENAARHLVWRAGMSRATLGALDTRLLERLDTRNVWRWSPRGTRRASRLRIRPEWSTQKNNARKVPCSCVAVPSRASTSAIESVFSAEETVDHPNTVYLPSHFREHSQREDETPPWTWNTARAPATPCGEVKRCYRPDPVSYDSRAEQRAKRPWKNIKYCSWRSALESTGVAWTRATMVAVTFPIHTGVGPATGSLGNALRLGHMIWKACRIRRR